MALSDLASIGSLVSGIAVLISLVFLYFQLRQVNAQVLQTEKNQLALISQGVVNRTSEMNRWILEPHISDVFLKARNQQTDLSEKEIFHLTVVFRLLLGNAQDAYLQHSAGLVDQVTFDQIMTTLKFWLGNPIFRAIWKSQKVTVTDPEWASYLDRMVNETPLNEPSDIVARFKSNLAEVVR